MAPLCASLIKLDWEETFLKSEKMSTSKQWFSKVVPRPAAPKTPREAHIKNANSQAPGQTSWIRNSGEGVRQWICVITSPGGDAHQGWAGWTLPPGLWDPRRAQYLHEIWMYPATSILPASAAPCPGKLGHCEGESRMTRGSAAPKGAERCPHREWRIQKRGLCGLYVCVMHGAPEHRSLENPTGLYGFVCLQPFMAS